MIPLYILLYFVCGSIFAALAAWSDGQFDCCKHADAVPRAICKAIFWPFYVIKLFLYIILEMLP